MKEDENEKRVTARPPPGAGEDVYSAATVAGPAPPGVLELVRAAEASLVHSPPPAIGEDEPTKLASKDAIAAAVAAADKEAGARAEARAHDSAERAAAPRATERAASAPPRANAITPTSQPGAFAPVAWIVLVFAAAIAVLAALVR